MRKYFAVFVFLLLMCGLVSATLPASDIPPHPGDTISDMINELLDSPGELGTTEESVLYYRDMSLGAGNISPYGSDAKVCLSLGKFKGSSVWEDQSSVVLYYLNKERLWVKFNVMCDNGNRLESSILANGNNKIVLQDVENCGCINKDILCCVAVLAETRSAEEDIALGVFVNNLVKFLTPVSLVLFFVGLVLILLSSKSRLLRLICLAKTPLILFVFLHYVLVFSYSEFPYSPPADVFLTGLVITVVLAIISVGSLIKSKGKVQKRIIYGLISVLAAELILILFTGLFWYHQINVLNWDFLNFVV